MRAPSPTPTGTPPETGVVQMPLPGEPTNNWTPPPVFMGWIGHANGHGRPELRLDQVAPASCETWTPVAPEVPTPPELVAEDDPK